MTPTLQPTETAEEVSEGVRDTDPNDNTIDGGSRLGRNGIIGVALGGGIVVSAVLGLRRFRLLDAQAAASSLTGGGATIETGDAVP